MGLQTHEGKELNEGLCRCAATTAVTWELRHFSILEHGGRAGFVLVDQMNELFRVLMQSLRVGELDCEYRVGKKQRAHSV